MSDARQQVPTLDEQINVFRGFTTVDGETRAESDAEKDIGKRTAAVDAGELNEDGSPKGKKEQVSVGALELGDPDEGDGGKPKDQGKPKPKNDAQERINKAVGRQRAAERRADAAEARLATMDARLAALESGKPLTRDKGDVNDGNKASRPDPAKYQYGELDTKYISDLARFEARQEMQAERDRDRKSNETRQQRERAQAHDAAMADFQDKGLEKFEDFDETVMESAKNGDWPLTEVVGELLLESDVGPEIAYFLATNVKEANKLAKLSPARQAIWFGKKEAELSSSESGAGGKGNTPPPKTSKAPPPLPNRVRGSGGQNPVSSSTNDFAAFEAMAMHRQ